MQLRQLVERSGGQVVGLAVVVYQPTPATPDFSPLPFYYLAKLEGIYYRDAAACELCRSNVPLQKVWI
jgi:orotate phosphoribosyltransferase